MSDDQGVDAEEIEASPHQAAHARSSDIEELGDLGLLEPLRRDRLLELDQELGGDP